MLYHIKVIWHSRIIHSKCQVKDGKGKYNNKFKSLEPPLVG